MVDICFFWWIERCRNWIFFMDRKGVKVRFFCGDERDSIDVVSVKWHV